MEAYLDFVEDYCGLALVIRQAVKDFELVDQNAAGDSKVCESKGHSAIHTDLGDLIGFADGYTSPLTEFDKCRTTRRTIISTVCSIRDKHHLLVTTVTIVVTAIDTYHEVLLDSFDALRTIMKDKFGERACCGERFRIWIGLFKRDTFQPWTSFSSKHASSGDVHRLRTD